MKECQLLKDLCQICLCLYSLNCWSQKLEISGFVFDYESAKPLEGVAVQWGDAKDFVLTDTSGKFILESHLTSEQKTLQFSHPDYRQKRLPVLVLETIFLDKIFLRKNIPDAPPEVELNLSDPQLLEEGEVSNGPALLQATQDIYQNVAAFEFGPTFFKIRGLDRKYQSLFINSIPLNRFFDGRPQWNNLGGLNDALRDQQFYPTYEGNPYNQIDLLGTNRIRVSPSGTRKGSKITSSLSNRTYANRLMFTHNTGLGNSPFGLLFTISRRTAEQGYRQGTLYSAYSGLLSLEYLPSSNHRLNLTALVSRVRKGRAAPLTAELIELLGSKYNPYWGWQNGKIRNSREFRIQEPWTGFQYEFLGKKLELGIASALQWGLQERDRLAYANAPNPNPDYYRNAPGYYLNSEFGASLENRELVKQEFLAQPQLNWEELFRINEQNPGSASYVISADVVQEKSFNTSSFIKFELTPKWEASLGGLYQNSIATNFAETKDLLGANFYRDEDPFTNTRNDVEGNLDKERNEKINYHYQTKSRHHALNTQLNFKSGLLELNLTGSWGNTLFQRIGMFLNDRFPDSSKGPSDEIRFEMLKGKIGYLVQLSGRHWISGSASILKQPPVLRNVFTQVRERGYIESGLSGELITSTDLGYFGRWPGFKARISGFYTRIQNQSRINSFYVDSGLGSAFVTQGVLGIDTLHKGIEWGFEWKWQPEFTTRFAGSWASFTYANNPQLSINLIPGNETDISNGQQTRIDLGAAQMKGLKIAAGPSKAISLGMRYSSPDYWWINLNGNYLAESYPDLAIIRRTKSFELNPETGLPAGVLAESKTRLLRQSPLPEVYLLNLAFGKSWRLRKHFISCFLSINNVMAHEFYSGGFEQSRNGNILQLLRDNLSEVPSFGNKYWSGIGRSYFLNLSWSINN